MKRMLLLLLCFSVFACSKMSEEEINEQKIQEISKNIVGRWTFSRVATDAAFKEVIDVTLDERNSENFMEFTKNGIVRSVYRIIDSEKFDEEIGTYEIVVVDGLYHVSLKGATLSITDTWGYGGGMQIPFCSQNIVVFYREKAGYIEFKRISTSVK